MDIGANVNERIFRRTEVGNTEIRERILTLSKTEQTILVAIDGEATYAQLSHRFEVEETVAFEMAVDGLLAKGLIYADPPYDEPETPLSEDLRKANIQDFDGEDFFSSSLDPMRSSTGSGLVVDTRKNTLRTVNLKKEAIVQAKAVDLFLPLDLDVDLEDVAAEDGREDEVHEVYPQPPPAKAKKSRKSKKARAKSKARDRWMSYLFAALIGVGLFTIGFGLYIAR